MKNNEIIENHINDLVGEIIKSKYSFTPKELKAMIYHIEYDIDTVVANHNLEEYGLEFTLEDSKSAVEKLKNILKKRNE